jgi:hypothetical protein
LYFILYFFFKLFFTEYMFTAGCFFIAEINNISLNIGATLLPASSSESPKKSDLKDPFAEDEVEDVSDEEGDETKSLAGQPPSVSSPAKSGSSKSASSSKKSNPLISPLQSSPSQGIEHAFNQAEPSSSSPHHHLSPSSIPVASTSPSVAHLSHMGNVDCLMTRAFSDFF